MKSALRCVLLVATGVFIGGCASNSGKLTGLPNPRMGPSAMPTAGPTAPSFTPVAVPEWKPIFDWMKIEAFYPPSCHPIYASRYVPPEYERTPRAWFPSIDECTSLKGDRTLYHLGQAGSEVMDYVVFLRNNTANRTRPIFQIRKALEILWAPDGSRAAVTVMNGSNYAEVVLLPMADPTPTAAIAVEEALAEYFSPYLIRAPQFVMALSWTSSGYLILRARGAEPLPPYHLFGYELLVDTDHLGLPGSVRFLRGYDRAPNPDAPRTTAK